MDLSRPCDFSLCRPLAQQASTRTLPPNPAVSSLHCDLRFSGVQFSQHPERCLGTDGCPHDTPPSTQTLRRAVSKPSPHTSAGPGSRGEADCNSGSPTLARMRSLQLLTDAARAALQKAAVVRARSWVSMAQGQGHTNGCPDISTLCIGLLSATKERLLHQPPGSYTWGGSTLPLSNLLTEF